MLTEVMQHYGLARPPIRRITAVLAQLLPARRSFWGERCAWMAATLKESAEDGDNTWSDFALVARDLLGEGPLDAIRLAGQITKLRSLDASKRASEDVPEKPTSHAAFAGWLLRKGARARRVEGSM